MTGKTKINQLRWLAATLLLVAAMVMPSKAWAQTMYTVFDTATGTLTFKYGTKPTSTDTEKVYDVPSSSGVSGWYNNHASSIQKVVFDVTFKDARPQRCYAWFYDCLNLTTISGIENLNTEEVTDMENMFYGCTSLTTLDLSGFNTAKVKYMDMMFYNCSKLTTIFVSDKFTTSAVTSSTNMFGNCTSLAGAIKFDSSKTDANYANMNDGYFTLKGIEAKPKGAYVVYTDADKTLTFKYGEIPTSTDTENVYDVPSSSAAPGWKTNHASSIQKVVFDVTFKDARPKSCYSWFDNCTSLTTISGIENLNTEEVTDMGYMFKGCESLTTLDLSGFNTAKVKEMSVMFYGCTRLTTIFVSDKFTTSAVTSSINMFGNCPSLAGAIKYDPDKKDANYANMNDGYFTLVGTVAKPKGAYVVYKDADNTLTFKYGEIPESTDTEKVYDIPYYGITPEWQKNHAPSIQKVEFDVTFKDARPKSCQSWFQACTSLTTISGIENLNTEEVTDMGWMFCGCESLTTLDLSGFNTAKVELMNVMFHSCSKLTTIFVSDKFTTSAVTSSTNMFGGCSSLVGAIKYDYKITDATYANYRTGYFSYGIKTADDLKKFAQYVNGTYTVADGETQAAYPAICAGLMNDITMTENDNVAPIGSNGYTGTFDGRGHSIGGLNFNAATSAIFSKNSGTIKNLGVVNAAIASGSNGSICQTNSGTIENCFFAGTTEGTTSPSGAICQTNSSTVTNCYYLAESETDLIEGTTAKTANQFESGEVAWLLNGSSSDGAWGQQIGTDDYPVPGSDKTVYEVNLLCGGVKAVGKTYVNNNEDVKMEHDLQTSASFIEDKKIYSNVCHREGCGVTVYYANAAGTIEATPNAESTEFTVANYSLKDATAYDNECVFTVTDFTYTRTFSNTNWTTWYVPFDLELTKDICDKYDFSRINNVHQYDDNGDGNADRTVVESFRQNEGVKLKANYPYLVRAKSEGYYDMSLPLTNVVPALAETNSIDCQSVDYKYTFTGTYAGMGDSGSADTDPYTLCDGNKWLHFHSLNPMRHYLTIVSRNASSPSPASMRSIMLSIVGDEDTTGIVKLYDEERKASETYDLSGRRLPAGSKPRGLIIENGKVTFKK